MNVVSGSCSSYHVVMYFNVSLMNKREHCGEKVGSDIRDLAEISVLPVLIYVTWTKPAVLCFLRYS